MATILSDTELKKLFGTVIIRGDESCLRPNSYILRLGKKGEYLNTGKKFFIDNNEEKKGVKIPPGHSIGLISYEDIDFSRNAVEEIFPGHDLHAFLTPTTNLSREGIVAPATQIDAGWHGTLNWTVVNTSNLERQYVYKSKMFRMTVFKLGKDEKPLKPYDGHYQKQFGYVKSKRSGPPVGMEDSEWETAYVEGGPENLLQVLAKTGPPWNVLSERLAIIDHKFKAVTNEYKDIDESIEDLKKQVGETNKSIENLKIELTQACTDQAATSATMKEAVKSVMDERIPVYEIRWWVIIGKYLLGLLGLALTAASSEYVMAQLNQYGMRYGIGMVLIALIIHFVTRKK